MVEISGRSQLYDLEESSPNALKSDKSTNKNGIVNIMCLILLRFCDIIRGKLYKFTKVNKRGYSYGSTSYKIIHKRQR